MVVDSSTAPAMAWATAIQLTLIVLNEAGLVQAAAGLAGAAGRAWAWASPELVVATWTTQLVVAHAMPAGPAGSGRIRT